MTEGMIVRNRLFIRVIHWLHLFNTLILVYTGLAITSAPLNLIVIGQTRLTLEIHRHISAAFVITLMILVADRGKCSVSFAQRMSVLTKHNLGQRLLLSGIVVSTVILAASGVSLWVPDSFSAGLIRWMAPVHELAAIIFGVVSLWHVFIGSGLYRPYRGAWRWMLGDGLVGKRQAESLWPGWLSSETSCPALSVDDSKATD